MNRSGDGNDWTDSRERRRRGDRAMSARDGDGDVPGWWVFVFVVLALATLAGVLVALGGL